MDTSEVERELEELETRLERLRALYEQHFMGLEKLEPLTPRKDVDRRIWVLRREQIRNTGLRFKFQMLVQRYNTFQQYWGRILREIESGTYRRDVMRAAKRFGEQEALTILGKRRAQKYANLAAAQEMRRNKTAKEAAVEELPDEYLEEEPAEEEFLSDSDFHDEDDLPSAESDAFDDESPTPAPLGRISTLPELPPPAPPPAAASANPPAVTSPNSPVAASSNPGAAPPRALELSTPTAPRAPEVKDRLTPVIPPPRPTDPEAAKRRVAELAAQARSQRGEASRGGSSGGPLELDLDFDGPEPAPAKPAPAAPRRASSAKMKAVKPPPARSATPAKGQPGGSGTRRPSTRAMRIRAFIAVPPARISGVPSDPRPSAQAPAPSPSADAASPAASAPAASSLAASTPAAPSPPPADATAPPQRSADAAEPPGAKERPRPAAAQRASKAADRGLDEPRLREIYAKYIETKRSANESTAGITFEKLAESLRAQTAKLRESHPVRSVDYDVVVKNGKTLIKPILK